MVEEGETRAYAQCCAMGGIVSGGIVGDDFRISAAMVGRLRVEKKLTYVGTPSRILLVRKLAGREKKRAAR